MTTVNERRFYVYAYLRTDGTPYYIGKGQGRRIVERHTVAIPPPERQKILIDGLTDPEAIEYEIALIHCLGRKDLGTGCLRNLTDGGDGTSGYAHTEEHKRKMSELFAGRSCDWLVGRTCSPETREKIASAQRGKVISQDAIEKIKAARANQVITDAHKNAIGKALTGVPKSEQHKQALSAASDPEVKRAASLAGWRKSPARGAAISAGKQKPQVWHHPDHGTVTCSAKVLMERFGVANLTKLKQGIIRQSKGWTWHGEA